MRLDIARFVRYARARVYAIAVRIHAAVYFGGSLGTRTPMEFDCTCHCEAVGGPLECPYRAEAPAYDGVLPVRRMVPSKRMDKDDLCC